MYDDVSCHTFDPDNDAIPETQQAVQLSPLRHTRSSATHTRLPHTPDSTWEYGFQHRGNEVVPIGRTRRQARFRRVSTQSNDRPHAASAAADADARSLNDPTASVFLLSLPVVCEFSAHLLPTCAAPMILLRHGALAIQEHMHMGVPRHDAQHFQSFFLPKPRCLSLVPPPLFWKRPFARSPALVSLPCCFDEHFGHVSQLLMLGCRLQALLLSRWYMYTVA